MNTVRKRYKCETRKKMYFKCFDKTCKLTTHNNIWNAINENQINIFKHLMLEFERKTHVKKNAQNLTLSNVGYWTSSPFHVKSNLLSQLWQIHSMQMIMRMCFWFNVSSFSICWILRLLEMRKTNSSCVNSPSD